MKREYPILRGASVEVIKRPCPLCRKEGRTTIGGDVPVLRHKSDDDRLFCAGLHGYLSEEELA